MRKRISFLLTLLLVLGNLTPTFACTATIIGKNVSADGNPIIARTEDWSSSYNKTFIVVPAKTYAPGDMYEDAYGFTWPMPKQTYKYIAVPDGYQEDGDIFEAAGWNEYGVAMTATVTAECNEA
ncbi:MAG TPA: C69 family dipeptidase, partial [Bacillota bacterium]|nr:C69 family dipeptidase [Bacillota bacterium]